MAEKAGVAQHYLIICELCELCEQMPSVYFLRKVSMVSGKVARKSAKYKPPGYLIEAIAEGRLLLLSPWPHYVPNKGRCSRAECTAMNAMAEAISNAEVRNAEVRNAAIVSPAK